MARSHGVACFRSRSRSCRCTTFWAGRCLSEVRFFSRVRGAARLMSCGIVFVMVASMPLTAAIARFVRLLDGDKHRLIHESCTGTRRSFSGNR